MVKINISAITDSIIEAAKKSVSFTRSIFTEKIPKPVWGVCGLAVAFSALGIYLSRRWVEAAPNEWLIVIRNGKLVHCGVGLKVFAGPSDTIVKFPSKMQKVYFSANNVTKEMQGINITGFAFWCVSRQGDGPFKCYKYMQGGNANNSVSALSESVIRNLIANSTLEDVMKNRDLLRDAVLQDLKAQLTGWGIWIESVEITEVQICSRRLFQDLQAEYRQETRLKAQFIELEGKEKLEENRQASDLKMSEINQTNETKKLQTKNREELKRKNQEEAYEGKKAEMEIEKLKRQKDMKLQEIKNSHEKAVSLLKNEQTIADERQNFELQTAREELDMDRLHDETTLKKYKMDATERIIKNLGLKEVKINQFSSSKSGLQSFIPTIKSG